MPDKDDLNRFLISAIDDKVFCCVVMVMVTGTVIRLMITTTPAMHLTRTRKDDDNDCEGNNVLSASIRGFTKIVYSTSPAFFPSLFLLQNDPANVTENHRLEARVPYSKHFFVPLPMSVHQVPTFPLISIALDTLDTWPCAF